MRFISCRCAGEEFRTNRGKHAGRSRNPCHGVTPRVYPGFQHSCPSHSLRMALRGGGGLYLAAQTRRMVHDRIGEHVV
jgi:hypothetical protein